MFRINDHFVSAGRAARRASASLGLAALVLGSTLGAPTPTLAQGPIIRDHRNGGPPAARIQVNLKSVKILNDRDWGKGEMEFYFQLTCFQLSESSPPCVGGYGSAHLTGYGDSFSIGSGETRRFDLPLSEGGRPNPDYDASAEGGLPLRAGHRYRLDWGMSEKDDFTDYDRMGVGEIELKAENDWGVGTYILKSDLGYYEIEFDVVKLQLPDLRPVNIKVSDLPGNTKKRVCMPVQNIEPGVAGPFDVLLRVDGAVPFDGRTTMPGLTPGNHVEACVETDLAAGPHKLEAIVDPVNTLLEFNEANNVYESTHTVDGPGPKSSPSPEPGPILITSQGKGKDDGQGEAQAQADLVVSSIRVNGRVPDGKDDCKDGKNTVSVVVKNAGAAEAGAFAVRLVVDGGEPIEKSVGKLEAGQEREVQFEDVRLKKGERKLTASAGSKASVADANEENNGRTATATCQGAA